MDERAILHRYKATRMAMIAGMSIMSGWFLYDLFIKKITRWDFLVILWIVAILKLIARVYYQKKN